MSTRTLLDYLELAYPDTKFPELPDRRIPTSEVLGIISDLSERAIENEEHAYDGVIIDGVRYVPESEDAFNIPKKDSDAAAKPSTAQSGIIGD
jgi:hypothetical protein